MITIQAIQETTKINQASKQWALDNLDYINSSNKLLGTSLKVEKGESEGYYTSVLYMQPADKVSTVTLCAAADLFGCKKDCLIGSGMLGLTTGQAAATRRTILFLLDSGRFYSMLRKEVEAKHKKHGNKLAIRLNGTSDLDFIEMMNRKLNIDVLNELTNIQFYDYTKNLSRAMKYLGSRYHLTFSRSEVNSSECMQYLIAGGNVAMVFDEVPSKFMGFNVINGDETDLRYMDEQNVIVGLKAKGDAKKDNSGFVIKKS